MYCATAYSGPYTFSNPHSYHNECAFTMKGLAGKMIGDYEQNKPGYDEILPGSEENSGEIVAPNTHEIK